MSRVSNLFRLQEIDLELLDSQARIEQIDLILGQDEEVRQAESLLEEREGALTEARSANSSADHAVASQRAKITQTDKALYGGSVTNPKELQDLQMESESLHRYLETLEDRYLEAMVSLEQAENAHLEATEALDVLQQRKARQHSQLTTEKEDLIGNIARLDEERQAATVDVTDEDYALYDDLRGRLGGKAMALLSDGVCSACGVELARSKQQEVSSGSELIRCSQCSRILYAG
jgi:predicted  nucleic acid-binding Zn-ribbon protein